MAETGDPPVDVADRDALTAWLETLPPKARTGFAARAALRSLPAALARLDKKTEGFDGPGFVLACVLATLISGAAGTWPAPEMSAEIRSAAAAASAFSARSAAAAAADSAALSAQPDDAAALFQGALWVNGQIPEGLRQHWEHFEAAAPGTPWAFWADWYRGMLTGELMDWELQRRVALIEPDDWDKGPERIAQRIEQIREELGRETGADLGRAPELEPQTVKHLFENRTIVSAGARSLSASIMAEFEAFRAGTGLNQTPELFLPMEALPPVLTRIADILQTYEPDPQTERLLREEVGRLNARVKELESALAHATRKLEDFDRSSWKRAAAYTIGGANVFGILAAAVWTVSGDEVGAIKRLETLQDYREVLFERPPPGGASLSASDGDDISR